MDAKHQKENCSEGRMPSMAPLANAYVPFQLNSPPKYDAREGIKRGTLFPGLDLPFMGMVNKTSLPVTPKTELQVLMFAIQELALYLDTHQEDSEALELYQAYQQMYHKCMMEFGKEYRPMNHCIPTERKNYQWLDDPWPWEYAANKEV